MLDRQTFLTVYGPRSLFSLTVGDIEPWLPESLSFASDEAAERFIEHIKTDLAWYFEDWDDAIRAAISEALAGRASSEA